MTKEKELFVSTLIKWSRTIDRPMPWKGIKNPYFIWLSEIILQQTRVEQGMNYYLKFTKAYPKVEDLAKAPIEEVLKHWEGLGYYSRARNLHHTAQIIVEKYNGIFPSNHADILSLKGIGPYTAAAIASFAYDLPYAVVDGNVIRVLSRYFGIDIAFDIPAGRKKFDALAIEILPQNQSAIYNQAIMDFGATVCKPAAAECSSCVMQKKCCAYQQDKVELWPIKANKTKVEIKYFNYFVLQYKNKCYIKKREKDFWKDLYEFYLMEDKKLWSIDKLSKFATKEEWQRTKAITFIDLTQKLSHRDIQARFFAIELNKKPALHDFIEVDKSNMSKFAFPKIINSYVENYF